MGATLTYDPTAFKQMGRVERLKFTTDVRKEFQTFLYQFLAEPTKPSTHKVGNGRRAAWSMGWSGWNATDGPCGWPMSITADGRLYKGILRTSINRLTAHQMLRATEVLSTPK